MKYTVVVIDNAIVVGIYKFYITRFGGWLYFFTVFGICVYFFLTIEISGCRDKPITSNRYPALVSLVVMFWLVEPPLIDPLSLPMAITLFLLKDPIKLMPYEISGLGWSIHPKFEFKAIVTYLARIAYRVIGTTGRDRNRNGQQDIFCIFT